MYDRGLPYAEPPPITYYTNEQTPVGPKCEDDFASKVSPLLDENFVAAHNLPRQLLCVDPTDRSLGKSKGLQGSSIHNQLYRYPPRTGFRRDMASILSSVPDYQSGKSNSVWPGMNKCLAPCSCQAASRKNRGRRWAHCRQHYRS